MTVEWMGQFVKGMTQVQRLETAMEFLGNVLDMHQRAQDVTTELRELILKERG